MLFAVGNGLRLLTSWVPCDTQGESSTMVAPRFLRGISFEHCEIQKQIYSYIIKQRSYNYSSSVWLSTKAKDLARNSCRHIGGLICRKKFRQQSHDSRLLLAVHEGTCSGVSTQMRSVPQARQFHSSPNDRFILFCIHGPLCNGILHLRTIAKITRKKMLPFRCN